MLLEGKRIILKPLDKSDFDLFIELSMCPIIMKHVCAPCTTEQATELFAIKSEGFSEECPSFTLSISDKFTDEKLGSIGLKVTDTEAELADVGFILKQSAQGNGFGLESLNLLKGYAFTTLNLNKLTATCSVANTGSIQLLEKSGFNREGCLRQNTLIGNQLIDDFVYGITK